MRCTMRLGRLPSCCAAARGVSGRRAALAAADLPNARACLLATCRASQAQHKTNESESGYPCSISCRPSQHHSRHSTKSARGSLGSCANLPAAHKMGMHYDLVGHGGLHTKVDGDDVGNSDAAPCVEALTLYNTVPGRGTCRSPPVLEAAWRALPGLLGQGRGCWAPGNEHAGAISRFGTRTWQVRWHAGAAYWTGVAAETGTSSPFRCGLCAHRPGASVPLARRWGERSCKLQAAIAMHMRGVPCLPGAWGLYWRG